MYLTLIEPDRTVESSIQIQDCEDCKVVKLNKIRYNFVQFYLCEIKAIAGLFFNITYAMMKGP